MISLAYFNIHRVVYHAINFTFWVFTKTLLPLHKMHYYSSFWGLRPQPGGMGGGFAPRHPVGLCLLYPHWGHRPPSPSTEGEGGLDFLDDLLDPPLTLDV